MNTPLLPWSRTLLGAALSSAVLALGIAPAIGEGSTGGPFRLVGTVVGGGGTSTGDGLTLTGVVPGPPAGVATGGAYRLTGGAIFEAGGPPPGPRPTIQARLTADKLAELTWEAGLTGYVLEFSPAVGPGAVWQPADPQPAGNVFVTPCQQPARYFRLRLP